MTTLSFISLGSRVRLNVIYRRPYDVLMEFPFYSPLPPRTAAGKKYRRIWVSTYVQEFLRNHALGCQDDPFFLPVYSRIMGYKQDKSAKYLLPNFCQFIGKIHKQHCKTRKVLVGRFQFQFFTKRKIYCYMMMQLLHFYGFLNTLQIDVPMARSPATVVFLVIMKS